MFGSYSHILSQAEQMRETVSRFLSMEWYLLTFKVLSALALAVQMIDTATRGKNGNYLKYDRRVIVVTDGKGSMDTEDLDQFAQKIRNPEAPIELVLLGVDFDDPDGGFKEEDKNSHKVRSDALHEFYNRLTTCRPRTRLYSRVSRNNAKASGEHCRKPSNNYKYLA